MAYPMDIFPEDDNYSQQESLYRGTGAFDEFHHGRGTEMRA